MAGRNDAGTFGVCAECDEDIDPNRLAAMNRSLWRLEEGKKRKMPLINLVLTLIVVGVALWLINRYIPMASSIKSILNVVVVVCVVVWVLQVVGLWGGISTFHVGR